jgi:hypothetical protein
MLKPPGTKRLKLKYDELLSNLAFKFNLRRYNMVIKVMVSSRTSAVFHVFELDFKMPRFCMYIPVAAGAYTRPPPSSS